MDLHGTTPQSIIERTSPSPASVAAPHDTHLAPGPAASNGATPHESAKPVIFVADADATLRRRMTAALRRRFGADYQIRSAGTAAAALGTMRRLAERGTDVALVIAELWLPGTGGVEFLGEARTTHPGAQRVLLTTIGDEQATEPLHRALALGQIDLFIEKPWRSPEEWIYPQLSEALGKWWRAHRPQFERVRVIGPQWSVRSHEMRDLFTRNAIPFGFYPEDDAAGERLLRDHAPDAAPGSEVVLIDGRALVNPTNAEIAEALGGSTHPTLTSCDVVIVGAGPAGLAAAVYAASEGLQTVVIEPEAVGGQAGTSAMIRNYLGFPRGVSGQDLAARAADQALQFGAQFVYAQASIGLRAEGEHRVVTLSDGSEVTSRTVVLAPGVAYRRLGIPALERLVGSGVFYGAVSEAPAMRGEHVFVVGAGNSAGQAALNLAEYADSVTILARGDSLEDSMSAYLIDQIQIAPNIDVRLHTSVADGHGRHRLEAVVLEDRATERTETVPAAALFAMIGAEPRTQWVDGSVERDDRGYIATCRDLAPRYEELRQLWPRSDRPPLPLETSLPGVFAAGDVRHNSVKRVASAVGEGAMAIVSVHEYLTGGCA